MGRVRRVLFWVLVAFIVYSIFTAPDQAADIARTGWDMIIQAFRSIGEFFDSLLSRA